MDAYQARNNYDRSSPLNTSQVIEKIAQVMSSQTSITLRVDESSVWQLASKGYKVQFISHPDTFMVSW